MKQKNAIKLFKCLAFVIGYRIHYTVIRNNPYWIIVKDNNKKMIYFIYVFALSMTILVIIKSVQ